MLLFGVHILLKKLALSGLGLIALAASSGVLLAQPQAAPAGDLPNPARQCKVTIDASQAPGTWDVTRQEVWTGECVCYVYAGPNPQTGETGKDLKALLDNLSCPDAKSLAIEQPETALGPQSVAGPGAVKGQGFLPALAPLLAAVGVGAGGVAALSRANPNAVPIRTSP